LSKDLGVAKTVGHFNHTLVICSTGKEKGRKKYPCLFAKPGIVKVLKVKVVRLD
jgi:hypothetical protein